NLDLGDALLVRVANDEGKTERLDLRADREHAPGMVNEEPAERFVVGALGDFGPEVGRKIVHGDGGVGEQPAVAQILDGGFFGVVFVADVADDHLEDVFEGDDPAYAAELVDHDRHVEAPRSHFAQHARDALRFGYEVDGGADELAERGDRELVVLD